MTNGISFGKAEAILRKTPSSYNRTYKRYRAEYCRTTGLPMYGNKDFPVVQAQELYTMSRARREHVEIDRSSVVGWYRTEHGYVPLFNKGR